MRKAVIIITLITLLASVVGSGLAIFLTNDQAQLPVDATISAE